MVWVGVLSLAGGRVGGMSRMVRGCRGAVSRGRGRRGVVPRVLGTGPIGMVTAATAMAMPVAVVMVVGVVVVTVSFVPIIGVGVVPPTQTPAPPLTGVPPPLR